MNFSRDSEETNEDNITSSIDSEQIKTDVVTHADEENTPADDVLDHKIAETTGNGEISDSTVFIFLSFTLLLIVYFSLGTQTIII